MKKKHRAYKSWNYLKLGLLEKVILQLTPEKYSQLKWEKKWVEHEYPEEHKAIT